MKLALVMEPSHFRDWFLSWLAYLKFQVLSYHTDGMELRATLSADALPDIVLLEAAKQETGALETTAWLRKQYPSIKVVALGMDATEALLQSMLDSGAAGVIKKYLDPHQIEDIIWQVHTKGCYTPYPRQGTFYMNT